MKRINIKCPYCGSQALLRPASVVHEHTTPGEEVYVCGRYPICDAYVSAHRDSHLPMGTLADARLRYKRRQAHIGRFSEYRCEQVINLCGRFTSAGQRAV